MGERQWLCACEDGICRATKEKLPDGMGCAMADDEQPHPNPHVRAWKAFAETHANIFDASTLGTKDPAKYLKNRLESAFFAGRDSVSETEGSGDPARDYIAFLQGQVLRFERETRTLRHRRHLLHLLCDEIEASDVASEEVIAVGVAMRRILRGGADVDAAPERADTGAPILGAIPGGVFVDSFPVIAAQLDALIHDVIKQAAVTAVMKCAWPLEAKEPNAAMWARKNGIAEYIAGYEAEIEPMPSANAIRNMFKGVAVGRPEAQP